MTTYTDVLVTDLANINPTDNTNVLVSDELDGGKLKRVLMSVFLGRQDAKLYGQIKNMLRQGANITLTANDSTKQITIDGAAGGGGGTATDPYPADVSGRWYMMDRFQVPTAGANIGLGRLRLSPFRLARRRTLAGLGTLITTAGPAASNLRLAIYALDPATGLPTGAPIVSTPDMSAVSSSEIGSGLNEANTTLEAGIYCAALKVDNTGVVIIGSAAAPIYGAFIGSTNIGSLFGSSTNGGYVFDYTTGINYADAFPNLTGVTPDQITQTNSSVSLLGKVA